MKVFTSSGEAKDTVQIIFYLIVHISIIILRLYNPDGRPHFHLSADRDEKSLGRFSWSYSEKLKATVRPIMTCALQTRA